MIGSIFFCAHEINVGVSIDAVEEYHNERRPAAGGRPSFKSAVEGFARLRERAILDGRSLPGVIAVYDERVSARAYWSHFIDILQADRFDILFPDDAFTDADVYLRLSAAYRSLVSNLWEIQVEEDDPKIRFRFFNDNISKFAAMRAGRRYTASFPALITVDLQGAAFYDDGLRHAIEAEDLKIGSWFDQEIYDLAGIAVSKAEQLSLLPSKCKSCEFLNACDGGELTYRYSPVSAKFDSYALCGPSSDLWASLQGLKT